MFEKQEYTLESLRKIRNKKWEFFIISRIIHGLSDDEIEFVTQQVVHPIGSDHWYLTDLYFPQFAIHLEIDERHHLDNVEKDKARQKDIVSATDEKLEPISTYHSDGATKTLDEVRFEVDALTDEIRKAKSKQESTGRFIPWSMDPEKNIQTILDRGYVSIADNVTFRLQTEALRCFGFTGISYQQGGWSIPDGTGDWVWFPRLYRHNVWENAMSNDGMVIHQNAMEDEARDKNAKQIERARQSSLPRTIVFAKAKDSLRKNVLRYVGTFQINLDWSNRDAVRFDRVSDWERTRAT